MDSKYCKIGACCWNSRYELLGMILLVIATALTIIAWDSFGIVAMFVVGLILVAHKHFCYIGCHSSCHTDHTDSHDGNMHCGAEGCKAEDGVKVTQESAPKK